MSDDGRRNRAARTIQRAFRNSVSGKQIPNVTTPQGMRQHASNTFRTAFRQHQMRQVVRDAQNLHQAQMNFTPVAGGGPTSLSGVRRASTRRMPMGKRRKLRCITIKAN
jgi:hypothetical protein